MNDEIFIPIAFFACVFGISYLRITARHREKMALIDKGLDASFLQDYGSNGRSGALKLGLLLVGIAVGTLIGHALNVWGQMKEEVAFTSMICLFGGLALTASYFLLRKKTQ